MLDKPIFTRPIDVLIDIAPVLNILGSFVLVTEAADSPGIGEWATHVSSRLTSEEWHAHKMISSYIGIAGLARVAQPGASFPDFLTRLEYENPENLRDHILQVMVEHPTKRLLYAHHPEQSSAVDPDQLLQDEQLFIGSFLWEKDDEDARAACQAVFEKLNAPPALQKFLVDYLQHFWTNYLQDEWNEQEQRLKQLVEAAELPNTDGWDPFEIIEAITHRNLRGVYRPEVLNTYQRMRFIPSPHCGPYIMRLGAETELQMIFDANLLRLLQSTPDADNNELLINKLRALADETRLSIVRMLKEHEELSTQAIIDAFDLSKAAASRHLRQLYANNIVAIRVDSDGLTKHYRLNPEFSRDLQHILAKLLA